MQKVFFSALFVRSERAGGRHRGRAGLATRVCTHHDQQDGGDAPAHLQRARRRRHFRRSLGPR